ncbi:MAG: hypothetical protein KC609_01265 [Myxococcales bacterium]|nr:hypothetical protein [Myxococcales bacterium]
MVDDTQSVDSAADDADHLLEGLVCLPGNPVCQTNLPKHTVDISFSTTVKAIVASTRIRPRRAQRQIFPISLVGPREGIDRGFERPPRTA